MRRIMNAFNVPGELCVHPKNQAPNVLKIDSCHTCDSKLCYICSQHHSVSLAHHVSFEISNFLPRPKYPSKALALKYQQLEEGRLAQLELRSLVCPCGVP